MCRDTHADIGSDSGKKEEDAAWYYPEPITDKAAKIKDYVAFCTYPETVEGIYEVAYSFPDKSKVDVKSE